MNDKKKIIYKPPKDPEEIIFKDSEIIVVNKPSGLLTIPGSRPEHKDSLLTRLKKKFIGTLLVHRLDMDTSGIIIFARTNNAQRELSKQFEKRKVEKTYIARIWGIPSHSKGTIEYPIISDFNNRPKQKICYKNGKDSKTEWKLKNSFSKKDKFFSDLIVRPITGRSHQIRIHLSSIGYPILGDSLYAHSQAFNASSRLLLHSKTLKIKHPKSYKTLKFVSDNNFD